jgi:hypothetical protein
MGQPCHYEPYPELLLLHGSDRKGPRIERPDHGLQRRKPGGLDGAPELFLRLIDSKQGPRGFSARWSLFFLSIRDELRK